MTTSSHEPDISPIAALMGDRARAAMLVALLDGRSLPAGDLARRADVSPSAASAHLAKLVAGDLLAVERSGRRRFYRIASSGVGDAVEALATLAKPVRIVALSQRGTIEKMRLARSCYDHLAGRLGVAVTEAFVANGALRTCEPGMFVLGAKSAAFFADLAIDVGRAKVRKRNFARQCLDWTERRPHVAGALGAAILERFLLEGWVERTKGTRALAISSAGYEALHQRFGIEQHALAPPDRSRS